MENIAERDASSGGPGNDKWFSTDHLKDNLKGKSVKGGANAFSGQMMTFSLTMLSNFVLGRLLMPEDFGLVAMVTSITGFIMMFKDMGMSAAVIQKPDISHKQVSTVFWVNVGVGIAFGLVILAAAPVISVFYKEPRLIAITSAYALSAVFGGLSAQHHSLMTRQMMFGRIAKIKVFSAVASVGTGIVMAFMGYGYWSIVVSNILLAFFPMILLWINCDWRPSRPKWHPEAKELINFGMGVSGFNFINYFSRNLDNILIGRFIGPAALGFYSKAYQFLMLPITQLREPLTAVGLPALGSLQKEVDKYRNYYKKYIFILAFMSMPLMVYLAVYADNVILFVLGENWGETAVLFRLLAISAFIQPVDGTRGLIMLSFGYSKRYFYWGLISSSVIITSFILGVYFGGARGVAIGYAIANYIIFIPSLMYCFKNTPITMGLFFRSISLPAQFSLIAGGIVWLAKSSLETMISGLWFKQFDNVLIIAISMLIYGLSYIGSFWILPGGKEKLMVIIDIFKMLYQRFFPPKK